MTDWKPDPAQLAWTRQFIAVTAHSAIWGAPAMGVFRVDQEEKKLRFTDRSPLFQQEMWERTVVAFGECGWEVVDATGEPGESSEAEEEGQ